MKAKGGMSNDALIPKKESKPRVVGPSWMGPDRCLASGKVMPSCHLPAMQVA